MSTTFKLYRAWYYWMNGLYSNEEFLWTFVELSKQLGSINQR